MPEMKRLIINGASYEVVDETARSRINSFTSLEAGSTTGDAELADIRVGYDGTEYDTAGEAVRNQIYMLSERVESVDGLSATEKSVLLTLFKAAAYTSDVSDKITELEAMWSVSYKIKYELTGVTIDNDSSAIVGNNPYTATLTASGGYSLNGATVTVIMAGIDITSTAYNNGIISIPSVTGNVSITAVGKEVPSYSVTNILDGVTTNNNDTKVTEGDSYSAILSAAHGYKMDGATVTITMNGVDITADVYANGMISIDNATGDIVITAVGVEIPVYTVTNNLTNVTNSNTQTEVSSTDGYYSATLTVADGYSMQSVVITMGGVDITADVYGDGGILITEVTGDIVITAVAGVALAYALAEPLTFAGSGNAVYDTGYAMYPNGTKDVSVCIDFDHTSSPWSSITLATANVKYGYKLYHSGNQKWRVNSNAADAETALTKPLTNCRMVYTQPKSAAFAIYILVEDVVTKITGTTYAYYPAASENTVTLGTDNTSFAGAINDFRVYDQILSDGQIEAYLRGGAI